MAQNRALPTSSWSHAFSKNILSMPIAYFSPSRCTNTFAALPHTVALTRLDSPQGGTEADSLNPNSSESNIRRSVDTVLEKLRGKKKLDLFECARVDKNFKIVDTISTFLMDFV